MWGMTHCVFIYTEQMNLNQAIVLLLSALLCTELKCTNSLKPSRDKVTYSRAKCLCTWSLAFTVQELRQGVSHSCVCQLGTRTFGAEL